MRIVLLNGNEYYMMALREYDELQYSEWILRIEDYEMVDFKDMFCEDSILPFGSNVNSQNEFINYNSASDYLKDHFATFNPEDNDGVISGVS